MINLSNVLVKYNDKGQEIIALENLTASISTGEFLCVTGPSGCGKSTLLHLIAGFLKASSGQILIDGRTVSETSNETGIVFQKFSLFPWLTVRDNIEFGLRRKKLPASHITELSQYYLNAIGLAEFSNNYPEQLSGGMQQRVALARAFATEPKVLLMDEPFASLDAQTSVRMRELLLQICMKKNLSVIFVTHDIEEAIFLADRVLVLSARPGTIRKDFKIDIPRPRNSQDFFVNPDFILLRKEILSLIKS